MKELRIQLTDEQAAEYAGWTEVQAFRIVDLGYGTARLELSNDLEAITAPENQS